MSRKCEFSGAGPETGNLVSHSNIKTRTRWLPNIKNKRYFIPELGQVLTLKLTTRAMRTIDKQGGISAALRKAKLETLSPRLRKIAKLVARPVVGRRVEAMPPAARRNAQRKTALTQEGT